MAGEYALYVFGDQTYDFHVHLRELVHNNVDDDPILHAFLERSYKAIRKEMNGLPPETRESLPRLTSPEDLIMWRGDGGSHDVPLSMALVCIYQILVFCSKHGQDYPCSDGALLIGLCTGSLPAAAVSCARNTVELLPLAVEAVRVAYRAGLCVMDVKARVEPLQPMTELGPPSWSMIVPNIDASRVEKQLSQLSALPITTRPFISAYTQSGVTLSGPPRSLAILAATDLLEKAKVRPIPIYAPYHAAHLFSHRDIDNVLGTETTNGDVHAGLGTRIQVLSSTTGQLVQARTFRDLLAGALQQILLEPIRWSELLDGVTTRLQAAHRPTCKVVPVGTVVDQVITSALKQRCLDGLPTLIPSPTGTRASTSHHQSGCAKRPKIAIVGVSGRYPGAKDNEAFWELLFKGLDVHKEVPPSHWDARSHVDPSGKKKNTSATPFGCWLDDPAAFDARFFNISPREAPQIDPAQRLALLTAYEAIEQAGIVPDATSSTRRDRVGVFYGVTSNDWMETNTAQEIDTYFIPGGNRAFIPGRINYFFKFSGPSYTVDTACSSSLSAIHIACNALWRGDVNTAITGGTNVLTNPDMTAGLDRGHFLSRTGNCKTFDDTADGYCRGEGVASVILKRLDDALADNDPILGLILGAYTNHSAEAESITRPHVGAQRAIFSKILNDAGVEPASVGYIECHGTGTQAGDATEMQSILDSFAPVDAVQRRRDDQLLYLGSAKANIGHGEAVSGVSSLAKVLLMLQKNAIPPHCGIKTTINRKFPNDLAERGVRIATEPVPWNQGDEPRRIFVNNFSAAGGNSALLVEDAPRLTHHEGEDCRKAHMIAVSAKNGVSLQGNVSTLLEYLRQESGANIGQLSYTTTARRIHHQHRVMVVGSSVEDLCTQLQIAIDNGSGMTRRKSVPSLIFTFTGQGAQFIGMGKELLAFSSFRLNLCRLDQLGNSLGFPSFMPVFNSDAGPADIDDLEPVVVQLASICMQIALSRLLASWGIAPKVVVGHSLGEYAALNVAGVLSDADTVYLVGKRALLLQQKCSRNTHSMLLVRTPRDGDQVAQILRDTTLEVACINSPTEVVYAGPNEQIAQAQQLLEAVGYRSTILSIPYAFHSEQVTPILDDFKRVCGGVTFRPPQLPVLCPLTGNVVTNPGVFGPEYLSRHCREPVNMALVLRSAYGLRTVTDESIFLEVGPHPAVSGMIKATLGTKTAVLTTSRRDQSLWSILPGTLSSLYCSGADIRWREYHKDFDASHRVIPLPAYHWDLKDYWIQYINDWSLRKGDPPLMIESSGRLETTSVHEIVQETSDGDKTVIVVEADLSRPDLNPLAHGHMVDDIPLCTPSVYADIALTLGKYLADRYLRSAREHLVDVSDMVISKALIAGPPGSKPQPLRAHAEVDWVKKSAAVKFTTTDAKEQPQQHATCVIRFVDGSRLGQLQKESADIKLRMQALRLGISEDTSARFNRAMVYRMIRPLAKFHEDYRAIDEVILDSNTLEAASRVSFASINKSGDFHTHPAVIDAFTQSCGFAMNCNDYCNLDMEVFMNHGWGSFQIFKEIHFDKEYQTYTKMREGADRLWYGDVFIFDGDNIVANFQQVAIQGVPRRVLKVILSLENSTKTQKPRLAEARSAPAPMNPEPEAIRIRPAAPASGQIVDAPSSRFSRALQIISEESGIAVADLTDDSSLGDIGIDSLLSLTITSRFREDLGLDLDLDSGLLDCETVGDIAKHLGLERRIMAGDGETNDTGIQIEMPRPQEPEFAAIVELHDEPRAGVAGALEIISQESGVSITDLTDDCVFSDMGVDSLLTLMITSRFREELSIDLPTESLFVDCPTVADLKALISGNSSYHRTIAESSLVELPSERKTSTVTIEVVPVFPSTPATLELDTPTVPRAPSVVLQGSTKTCSKTLFLFPDGSGSPHSYSSLPAIDTDLCLVALGSPYRNDAEGLRKCRLDSIVEAYLAEIRRRCPNGPYDLGGWSAGGILAYRAAQMLSDQGEEVLTLTLIDSPAPDKGLDRLPQHFFDYCGSLDLFGSLAKAAGAGGNEDGPRGAGGPPEWLIPHFNATIDVLHDYHAEPLLEHQCPGRISIIWASESITEHSTVAELAPHPDDTEGMKFLTEKRVDFSGGGWEGLFPAGNISIERMETHHFSMLRKPHAFKLAEMIKNALA